MSDEKKFTVAYATPHAAGKVADQLVRIIAQAKYEEKFKIEIAVYGKEFNDGFEAGRAASYRAQIMVDAPGTGSKSPCSECGSYSAIKENGKCVICDPPQRNESTSATDALKNEETPECVLCEDKGRIYDDQGYDRGVCSNPKHWLKNGDT